MSDEIEINVSVEEDDGGDQGPILVHKTVLISREELRRLKAALEECDKP